MSFIVPGTLIIASGFFVWLFVIVKPGDVGVELSSEAGDHEEHEDVPQAVSSAWFPALKVVFIIEVLLPLLFYNALKYSFLSIVYLWS